MPSSARSGRSPTSACATSSSSRASATSPTCVRSTSASPPTSARRSSSAPPLLFEGLFEDAVPLGRRGCLLMDHATLGHRPGRAVARPQRHGLSKEGQGLAPALLAIRLEPRGVRLQPLLLLQGDGRAELGEELVDAHPPGPTH